MTKQTELEIGEKKPKIIHIITINAKHYWKNNGKVKFIFTAIGIIVLFVYVGILQEKITKGCYGDNANKDVSHCETFKYELTLVLIKNLFGLFFVQVLNWIKPEKREDTTHHFYYVSSSAILSLSTVCSYMALRWVTFPMQVIFKSAKPLAVMMLGLFLCKRYKIQRYFFVLFIVIGVIVFKLFESKEVVTKVKNSENNDDVTDVDVDVDHFDIDTMYGTGLLVLSLIGDGVVGIIQDRMREIHAPTFRQFMFQTCAWCCIILSIAVIITGEIVHVFPFISRNSIVLWDFCALGFADALGNVFTYVMVASFGALATSVTTTVRKFFSVIFSIIFFANPSTPLQWVGAALVFGGLIADTIYGKSKSKTPKSKTPKTNELEDIEKGQIKVKTIEKDFITTNITPNQQIIYSIS